MNLLLTFILGFRFEEEISGTTLSREDVEPERTSLEVRGGKSNVSDSVSHKSTKVIKDEFLRPLAHMNRICKIQYNLASREDRKKAISVLYLGTCAEITFENVSTVVKCVIIDDKAFVPFTVLHHIDTKELNDIVHIKSNDIKFEFRLSKETNKGKTGGKLYYYFPEENCTGFGYLVETDKGKVPEKVERFTLKAGRNDYLFIRPCKFHWRNTSILMKRASDEIEFRRVNDDDANTVIAIEEETTKKMITPKDGKVGMTRKSRKPEKQMPPDMKMVVTGDNLLYEKSVWTFQDFNRSRDAELLWAGLILTNTCVYTSEQRSCFKTLSINVKSIRNLPPSVKLQHNVTKVYLEYSFPPVCKCATVDAVEIRDRSKVKFKDVRTFFNNGTGEDRLIEAIQNNLLEVKLLGLKEKADDASPRVWGQDLSCTDFVRRFKKFINANEIRNDIRVSAESEVKNSKRTSKKTKKSHSGLRWLDESKEDVVVLGYAGISLYDLMKYSVTMSTSAPVNATFLPTTNSFRVPMRPMNVMHFHRDFRPLQKGIVNANDFVDNETVIKIEAKLGYNLTRNVLHQVLSLPTIFTVCIIIDYDAKASYSLLKVILDHNKTYIPNGRGIPNVLHQNIGFSPEIHPGSKRSGNSETLDITDFTGKNDSRPKDQNYITGFMVDAIDFSILMIESLDIQAIPKIMVHRYQMHTDEGKMLYNSNLVFTERLYDEFLKFGGIFLSALGLPMDAVLNHSRVHEYVPPPALRCLQTLKSITKAKSIHRNLFPAPLELLSMDTEFGVPLHKNEIFAK